MDSRGQIAGVGAGEQGPFILLTASPAFRPKCRVGVAKSPAERTPIDPDGRQQQFKVGTTRVIAGFIAAQAQRKVGLTALLCLSVFEPWRKETVYSTRGRCHESLALIP